MQCINQTIKAVSTSISRIRSIRHSAAQSINQVNFLQGIQTSAAAALHIVCSVNRGKCRQLPDANADADVDAEAEMVDAASPFGTKLI